jgi:hypothetical protein
VTTTSKIIESSGQARNLRDPGFLNNSRSFSRLPSHLARKRAGSSHLKAAEFRRSSDHHHSGLSTSAADDAIRTAAGEARSNLKLHPALNPCPSAEGSGKTLHRPILLLTAAAFGANRQATWRGTALIAIPKAASLSSLSTKQSGRPAFGFRVIARHPQPRKHQATSDANNLRIRDRGIQRMR